MKFDQKVAVLGLGSIGLRHAGNFAALGCQVVGFDPDADQCARLENLGGKALTREQAINEADLAVIATPTDLHLEDIRDCLAIDRHILVEKPIAHAESDLRVLFDLATDRGVKIFPALNLRFLDVVNSSKRAIQSGRLGELLWGRFICASYLPDWRPGSDYRNGYAANPESGGVLFDLIHEVDLANHLLGPATTIAAAARNTKTLGIDAEDCADLMLQHVDGVHSSLHLDYVTRQKIRVTEIVGTEAMLRLDVSNQTLQILDVDGNILETTETKIGETDCYVVEVQCALRALNGEVVYPIDWKDALGVLGQVIDARRLAGLPTKT